MEKRGNFSQGWDEDRKTRQIRERWRSMSGSVRIKPEYSDWLKKLTELNEESMGIEEQLKCAQDFQVRRALGVLLVQTDQYIRAEVKRMLDKITVNGWMEEIESGRGEIRKN